MEPYKTRIASPADTQAVEDVLQASYSALMTEHYDAGLLEKALPLITRANPGLLASGTYYVAVNADDHAVGCGGWTAETPGTGEIVPELAHIRHFATHPEALGQGVGRQIYEASFRQAKKAGFKKFMCFSSLNATSFYTAMGFQVVDHVEVAMGPFLLFPSVVMETIL